MLIAILADIHGNLPALEAVITDAVQQGAEAYLVAGDIVTGPQANEVIARLVDLQACMILGNNEINMIGYARGTMPAPFYTYLQFGFTRHSYHLQNASSLEIIEGLPEQLSINYDNKLADIAPLHMVHGSPRRVDELIYPEQDITPLVDALSMISENILICGHTHQPWVIELDGKLAVNPGAVTGGLNGDPRAQYALLDWDGERWQVHPRQVAYPVNRIIAAFHESGLLEASGGFGRACLESFRTGRNTPQEFLEYAYQLTRQANIDDGYIPDDIWRAAEKSFHWSD